MSDTLEVPDSVIIPPPDIRNIVDKTASFVARNGINLQERIREKEQGNQKFCFLNPDDPYHVYYQWKLSNSKTGRQENGADVADGTNIAGSNSSLKSPTDQDSNLGTQGFSKLGFADKSGASGNNATTQHLPPSAPPPFEFIQEIPPVSQVDYDVIKLTALFTAKNGTAFMNHLSAAEARNHAFDFLKASHPLFGFFLKLVEQYQRVLAPNAEYLKYIEGPGKSKRFIISRIVQRAEYARWLEAHHREQEEERERERLAFTSIDWHDFVIVDTIDITEGDLDAELPAPTTLLELQCAALQQRRKGLMLTSGTIKSAFTDLPPSSQQVETTEKSAESQSNMIKEVVNPQISGKKEEVITSAEAQAIRTALGTSVSTTTVSSSRPKAKVMAPPALGPMRIKAEPVQRKQKIKEITQICPRCGMAVPVSEMEEHMRIELLDPKWREQREIFEQSKRETNLSGIGEQVVSSIKAFAERRFTGDEIDFQKKIKEDIEKQRTEAKKKIIWDGHTASIATATQKVKEIVPINEQIVSIHKAKGLIDNEANTMLPAAPQQKMSQSEPTFITNHVFLTGSEIYNQSQASAALSANQQQSYFLPSKPLSNATTKPQPILKSTTDFPVDNFDSIPGEADGTQVPREERESDLGKKRQATDSPATQNASQKQRK